VTRILSVTIDIEDWYHVSASNVGISIGGNNHSIKNNYFERTNVGGIAYAIRLENQTNKLSIIGNTFKTCDYGIVFLVTDPNTDCHKYATISENKFIDSNYGGIFGSYMESCVVSGNTFYDAGDEPILFTDSNRISILDNIIKDTGVSNHVLLDEGITVRGNGFEIIGNLIEAVDSSAIAAISVYGDGAADPNTSYNGENTIIKNK